MGQDMSATDAPFGFVPYGPVLRTNLYAVQTNPTIHVYHNDMVAHGGTGLSTKYGPMPIIEDSAVVETLTHLLGSVLAVFDHNMLPVKYITAAAAGDAVVAGYVLVSDDPNQLYLVQEDGVTNAIELSEIGFNIEVQSATVSLGNTNTGISTQEIDSDTANNTAALNMQLVRPHEDDTIANNTNCYARWIVRINEHAFHDVVGLGI